MSIARRRVAVIGAGVVGLSIARSLARAGVDVTVFEKDHLGAGTSSRTYGWVNSNGKQPASYHRLNCAGMAEHVALQTSAPDQAHWLDRTGTCEWAADASANRHLAARVASLRSLDYPVEAVPPATMRATFPELHLPPDIAAIWRFPSESIAHTAPLMAWLWSDAKAHGATLREGTEVSSIRERTDAATFELVDGHHWEGDHVVLATGRWTPKLTQTLGVGLAMIDPDRQDPRACGFLAVTDPLCVQLRANLVTPELNVRPHGGGRLLLQALDLDHRADPRASPPVEVGREMLARLHRLFANTAHARIERLDVGQRSRPADGLPAVGFLTDRRRAYVVATHSGITLGPLLGRLVAEELVSGMRDMLLAGFAPDRLVDRDADAFDPLSSTPFPAQQ